LLSSVLIYDFHACFYPRRESATFLLATMGSAVLRSVHASRVKERACQTCYMLVCIDT